MLAVQVWCRLERDKELRFVGVFPGIGHAHDARSIVFQGKVFVVEFPAGSLILREGTVAARSIEAFEIPPLYHKVGYDAMEFTSLVRRRRRLSGSRLLGGTERDKIRTRLGTILWKEFYNDGLFLENTRYRNPQKAMFRDVVVGGGRHCDDGRVDDVVFLFIPSSIVVFFEVIVID